MGAHDSGYKYLFSFKTMVEGLLRGFVHEQWVEALDFETLERKNLYEIFENETCPPSPRLA